MISSIGPRNPEIEAMSSGRKAFGPRFYQFLIVALLGGGALRVALWLELESIRAPTMDSGATVASLIPGLAAADSTARASTVHELGRVLLQSLPSDAMTGSRAQVVAALRGALSDEDPQVRAEVAFVLGNRPDAGRAAADELTKAAMNDQDHAVRLAAARALMRLGGEHKALALRALAGPFADPTTLVDRRAFVTVMVSAGEAGEDQAIEGLVGLLSDPDEDIRLEAVDCLTALGSAARRIVPDLERLLASDNLGLSYTAALAIVQTIEPVPPLDPKVRSAMERAVTDTSRTRPQRRDALEKLANLAPEALRSCGLELARQLNQDDRDIRLAAATLLQMIDPEWLAGKTGPGQGPQ
jgi:HEAT repeat protein